MPKMSQPEMGHTKGGEEERTRKGGEGEMKLHRIATPHRNAPGPYAIVDSEMEHTVAWLTGEGDAAGLGKMFTLAPAMAETLRECLSACGITVEQALDNVPQQPWEVQARAILAKLDKEG